MHEYKYSIFWIFSIIGWNIHVKKLKLKLKEAKN